ncbi:MAG: hypothetical protein R3F55_09485 [Alphaproteobacteria bacterium]
MTDIAGAPARPPLRGATWRRGFAFFLAVLRRRPAFALGYILVGLIVLLAVFAPLIAPFDPIKADPSVYLRPPGWPYLMGTDATGLDVFSRVIYAPRIDLAIALAGTLTSAVVGVALGAVAGYYESVRGWGSFGSGFIMRAADVLQAFPVFVFAIAVVAVMGQERAEPRARHRLRQRADLSAPDAGADAVGSTPALCRGGIRLRCVRLRDPDPPCDPERDRARARPSSRSISAGRCC